jgi:hypothetical protein
MNGEVPCPALFKAERLLAERQMKRGISDVNGVGVTKLVVI